MSYLSRAEYWQVVNNFFGERLPGRPDQNPYVASAVKNFVTGARKQLPDGRTFRYSQVGTGAFGVTAVATMVRPSWGVYSAIVAAVIETSVAAANAVLGAYSFVYTSIAAFPANHFQGGFAEYVHLGITYNVRIASHPLSAAGGAAVVITLSDPLPTAITAADVVNLHRCGYADVRSSAQEGVEAIPKVNDTFCTTIGVPLVAALEDEWFWLQVKGPAFVVPAGGNEGTVGYDRTVMFDTDGSVQRAALDYITAAPGACRSKPQQIIPCTQNALVLPQVPAACTGCVYIMLDLGD